MSINDCQCIDTYLEGVIFHRSSQTSDGVALYDLACFYYMRHALASSELHEVYSGCIVFATVDYILDKDNATRKTAVSVGRLCMSMFMRRLAVNEADAQPYGW